jgi:hypothetical protein
MSERIYRSPRDDEILRRIYRIHQHIVCAEVRMDTCDFSHREFYCPTKKKNFEAWIKFDLKFTLTLGMHGIISSPLSVFRTKQVHMPFLQSPPTFLLVKLSQSLLDVHVSSMESIQDEFLVLYKLN